MSVWPLRGLWATLKTVSACRRSICKRRAFSNGFVYILLVARGTVLMRFTTFSDTGTECQSQGSLLHGTGRRTADATFWEWWEPYPRGQHRGTRNRRESRFISPQSSELRIISHYTTHRTSASLPTRSQKAVYTRWRGASRASSPQRASGLTRSVLGIFSPRTCPLPASVSQYS